MSIIQDEISRINADTAQGEQSTMVQVDMKEWAQKDGCWPQADYREMIVLHAIDRGWLQPNFTWRDLVE